MEWIQFGDDDLVTSLEVASDSHPLLRAYSALLDVGIATSAGSVFASSLAAQDALSSALASLHDVGVVLPIADRIGLDPTLWSEPVLLPYYGDMPERAFDSPIECSTSFISVAPTAAVSTLTGDHVAAGVHTIGDFKVAPAGPLVTLSSGELVEIDPLAWTTTYLDNLDADAQFDDAYRTVLGVWRSFGLLEGPGRSEACQYVVIAVFVARAFLARRVEPPKPVAVDLAIRSMSSLSLRRRTGWARARHAVPLLFGAVLVEVAA